MDLRMINVESIPEEVKAYAEVNAPNTTFLFAAYLEYIDGEVVERTFGIRRYAKKGVRITEVFRRTTGKARSITKNLIRMNGMSGYIAIFDNKDRYVSSYGYRFVAFEGEDFDVWFDDCGLGGFSYTYINAEMVNRIEEFKCCGYSGGDVINYLNAYRKNPKIEFFGKFGIPLRKTLVKKAEKDKAFCKFLSKNADAIYLYGPQAALYAYKHNVSVEEARRICSKRRAQLDRVNKFIPELAGTKLDKIKCLEWCDKNKIGLSSYDDYLKAIKRIGLDLRDTKNVFPHDFARMHDLRVAEYDSIEAKADRAKRAELYDKFEAAAEKAKVYEAHSEEYVIIAPRQIPDLQREGRILCHCVGKMGYDKKMADGKSLIMFLRHADVPTEPFVTIEYSLDRKMLLQAYGYKDSRPDDVVYDFINQWAESVKKILNKKTVNV